MNRKQSKRLRKIARTASIQDAGHGYIDKVTKIYKSGPAPASVGSYLKEDVILFTRKYIKNSRIYIYRHLKKAFLRVPRPNRRQFVTGLMGGASR